MGTRDEFCEQVGITFDEFAIKQNGDFEIKDMLRAYYRGVERGSKTWEADQEKEQSESGTKIFYENW